MEKIISLDLDGTLVDKTNSIPQDTIDYLNMLIKSGFRLILTTGRPYRSMLKFAEYFPENTPLISENGAYIGTRDGSMYKELKRFSKKTFLDLFVKNKSIIKNGYFSVGHYAYIYNRLPKLEPFYHIDENTVVINGAYDLIKDFEAPNGAMFIVKSDEREKFEEYIRNSKKIAYRCYGYDQNNAVYEVSIAEIDKSIALAKVLKYLNASWSDLIHIGDGLNDLKSIKLAGCGVAMKNGEAEVREAAKYITDKTNEENGVLDFLKGYIKK